MKITGFGIPMMCLLLAGCGGSNDSLTTSPTPPPAAAPFPLTVSRSFQTITGTLTYSGGADAVPPSNPVFNALSIGDRSAAVTFSYDAASGTYTVQGGGVSASFGQANQIPDTAYSVTYAKTAGAFSDSVKLYGNVQSGVTGTPPVALSYLSYGIWTHASTASSLTSKTYFLYGQPTDATSMPTTGTASYQMIVSAHELGTGAGAAPEVIHLSGTATMNANFGTGAIDTILTVGPSLPLTGTGKISGDQFAGSFTGPGSLTDGKFNGGFFGPSAKEAGYTFQLTYHGNDPYAGATPGHSDMYITGAAVGPKG